MTYEKYTATEKDEEGKDIQVVKTRQVITSTEKVERSKEDVENDKAGLQKRIKDLDAELAEINAL